MYAALHSPNVKKRANKNGPIAKTIATRALHGRAANAYRTAAKCSANVHMKIAELPLPCRLMKKQQHWDNLDVLLNCIVAVAMLSNAWPCAKSLDIPRHHIGANIALVTRHKDSTMKNKLHVN